MKFKRFLSLSVIAAMTLSAVNLTPVYAADTAESALTAFEEYGATYEGVGGNFYGNFYDRYSVMNYYNNVYNIVAADDDIVSVDLGGKYIHSILANAFQNHLRLTSVSFNTERSRNWYIDKYAFAGCTALSNLNFSGCSSLEYIYDYAFSGCTRISKLDLTDCSSLKIIHPRAFEKCTILSELTLPQNGSFNTIGERAFTGCTSLKTVALPNTLQLIDKGAFAGSGITKITIPDSVTVIDDEAFKNCPLTDIAISPNVTYIGSDVFAGSNLKTVYCGKGSIADDASLYPSGVKIVYLEDAAANRKLIGDVDGDGKISANDSAIILQKALNGTFTMPVDGYYDILLDL